MLETLIAIVLILLMGGAGVAASLGPEPLLLAALWLVAAGLGFGVPTGVLYHWALQRSLRAAGPVPADWWLHPTRLHARLPRPDRARVLGWASAGALGFVVTLMGCLVGALGVAKTL